MSACPLNDLSRNPSPPAAFIPAFLDLLHSLFICQSQIVLSLSPPPLSSIVFVFMWLPLAFLLKLHILTPASFTLGLFTLVSHKIYLTAFAHKALLLSCITFPLFYLSQQECCFLSGCDCVIGYSHTGKRCSLLKTHLNMYMGMHIY